jgi:hypothetical protein
MFQHPKNSRRLSAKSALCGLLGFLFVACSAPDSNTDAMEWVCVTSVLEGEGVEFRFVDAKVDDFCPSSFEAVESHIRWVAEAWGVEPSPIMYGLFESREEPCWGCSEGAGACGRDGRLATTRLPDRHEVAHAAHGMNCTSLIEEGWAVLYGDPFEDAASPATLREAMDGIEHNGRLRSEHYPLAARFVAFLLDDYGIEAVKEICAITLPNANELDAALLEVLGASLDDVQIEFDEYPPWTTGELRQDQACEDSDLQPSVGSVSLELGCMAEGVEGKLDGRIISQGLFELPEFGNYTFDFAATEELEMWVELRNCERDSIASTHYDIILAHPKPGTPVKRVYFDLPAGVYVIRAMITDSLGMSPNATVDVTIGEWL